MGQTKIDFNQEDFKSLEDYNLAVKHLYLGDDFYADGEDNGLDGVAFYKKALNNYLESAKLTSDNAALNYRIGECYYQIDENIESDEYIRKSYELDSNIHPMVLYRLGQGAQFKLQFSNAIEFYNQFKDNYSGEKKAEWFKNTDKRILECTDGQDLTENFVGGLVKNLNRINSKYMEHSPVLTADEKTIFFTSRRPILNHETDSIGRFDENIFVAKKDINGNWMEAKSIGSSINNEEHNAVIGVSPDGKKLYLYDGENSGDILFSDFTEGEWSVPTAYPSPINSKHSETAISFSADGKEVFFVSDRPDGLGKKDIWRADVEEGGSFSNVRTMNAFINTPYNERSVFMHQDGKTMYFSSEGHRTMGGYDIFKSEKDEDGNWGEAQNIGYPVNTSGDDVSFVTSSDNKRGYFSAVKSNSKGEQDIYSYIFPEKSKEGDKIIVRGTVKGNVSKEPVLANIIFTNIETGKKTSINSDHETGGFIASIPKGEKYAVNVLADGFLLFSESINPLSDENIDFLLSFDLNSISNCKALVLENIWFEFDKSQLMDISFSELDELVKFLTTCNMYKVEVGGYTCTDGTEEYNVLLSEKRAQSVIEYLVSKGINKDRLVSKSYGSKNPIANNNTEDGKIKNRRVEIRLFQ